MPYFNYNPSVPNAPNDPAVDQPDMQTNTGSTKLILNVDHHTFQDTNGGLHKQITFSENNVPTPPTSPPILFTKNVNALPQLFFYSGNASQSSNQYAASANGSTFLLGGIILKWGTKTFGGSSSGNKTGMVSFSPNFPNNCYGVEVSLNSVDGTPTTNSNTIATFSITTSNFQYLFNSSSGSGSTSFPSFFWMAIGN